jgi:CheY-like chemotaxis protein
MTGAQGEILVVDDDPLNRAILRRGLERARRSGSASTHPS